MVIRRGDLLLSSCLGRSTEGGELDGRAMYVPRGRSLADLMPSQPFLSILTVAVERRAWWMLACCWRVDLMQWMNGDLGPADGRCS